jgi:hypothetical protein
MCHILLIVQLYKITNILYKKREKKVSGTGICQELQRCWVFHAQQFPVCIKNGPPHKGHAANLTQQLEALELTWPSIPVKRFRHLVESMPRQIEAVLRAKGRGARATLY